MDLIKLHRILDLLEDYPDLEEDLTPTIRRIVNPPPKYEVNEEEYEFLMNDQKIAAIKSFRARYGVGLLQAKVVMDQAKEHGRYGFDINHVIEFAHQYNY
jgi:hypothetical protein